VALDAVLRAIEGGEVKKIAVEFAEAFEGMVEVRIHGSRVEEGAKALPAEGSWKFFTETGKGELYCHLFFLFLKSKFKLKSG